MTSGVTDTPRSGEPSEAGELAWWHLTLGLGLLCLVAAAFVWLPSRSSRDVTVLLADVIYIKEGVSEKLVNVDIQDRLAKLAARSSADRLLNMAEFLRFIESSLKNNVNRQMLTDVLAIIGNDAASRHAAG